MINLNHMCSLICSLWTLSIWIMDGYFCMDSVRYYYKTTKYINSILIRAYHLFNSQHLHLDVFLDSFIAISFLGADVAIGESGDVFPVAKSDADIGMCGLYDAFVVDRFSSESFLKLGFIATFSI